MGPTRLVVVSSSRVAGWWRRILIGDTCRECCTVLLLELTTHPLLACERQPDPFVGKSHSTSSRMIFRQTLPVRVFGSAYTNSRSEGLAQWPFAAQHLPVLPCAGSHSCCISRRALVRRASTLAQPAPAAHHRCKLKPQGLGILAFSQRPERQLGVSLSPCATPGHKKGARAAAGCPAPARQAAMSSQERLLPDVLAALGLEDGPEVRRRLMLCQVLSAGADIAPHLTLFRH